MKMATVALLLVSALAAPAVYAAEADDHAAHHPGADKDGAGPAQDDKGGGMKMEKMHEQMKKMHQQMEKIHAATDPQERRKLMEEHMQSMRESMKMMRGMGGTAMGGKKKGEPMMEEGGKDPDKDGMPMGMMMMKRHKMMEDRLDTMQKMMEQMLEHEAAEQEMERMR
jgi:periplasmic protein CpxP/Spy